MKNNQSEILIIIDFGNSNTKVAEYNLETKVISEISIIEKNETEVRLKEFFDKITLDTISNADTTDTTNSINTNTININIIYSNVTKFEFETFAENNLKSPELSNFVINIFDVRKIFIELENRKLIEFSHILGIGTDRLLGLISSYLKYNTSCITIDFGTAITLNYIDYKGIIKGGQIIPGYFTQLNSLNLNTDKINLTNDLSENSNPFDMLVKTKINKLIGKAGNNTFDAVSWGIINSICGAISNFISTNAQINEPSKCNNIIFAGSYSLPFYEYFEVSKFSNNANSNLAFHHSTNLNINSIQNLFNLYPQLFN